MPLMNMFLILYKRSPTDLQKNEMMEVVRGYREAVHIKIKYDDHANMFRSVISFDDLYICIIMILFMDSFQIIRKTFEVGAKTNLQRKKGLRQKKR